MLDDWTDGDNPPYGASINYWLGSAPDGPVTIRITNDAGETVRTLDGTADVGLNRVWWDFDDERSTPIRIRTKPLYADWVDLGDDGVRQVRSGINLLQPPGTYTVTLEVDGQRQSQQLEVRKDPHSEGSLADIRAQLALAEELRRASDTANGLVNRIEWIRRQLYDLKPVLQQHDADDLVSAADDLDARLIAVERELYQMRRTGTGQDGLRWPTRITGRLSYLAGSVTNADFPPTDQMHGAFAVLQDQLAAQQRAFQALPPEVEAFNRMLADAGMAGVVTARAP